jgi:RNA polymerase sigma factor (sigma-70 family)
LSGDPDSELVIRAGSGDRAAIRELVRLKLPRILALARRMLGDPVEAEDVAQETFLRLWRQAPQWRPGGARIDSWVYKVALNLCYDRLRRRREIPTAEPPERTDPAPDQEAVLFTKSIAARIDTGLMALPLRQREAITLVHFQELAGAEAARIMGISVEALESLLARGRRSLRRDLADLLDD